jgi:hypothetical protein
VALALLAIYARRFVESGPLLHTLLGLTVIAGALLLAALARYPWDELRAAD